jgi:hypothetical protein
MLNLEVCCAYLNLLFRADTLAKEHPISQFSAWLQEEYKEKITLIESMINNGTYLLDSILLVNSLVGVIAFSCLWYLFPRGKRVYKYDYASGSKVFLLALLF